MAYYAAILATATGLNDAEIRNIYEAALLHDIGKISIPESILGKTGGLDSDEVAVMRSHVDNSIAIIRHLPSMDYLIPAAIGHHERWGGTGYPLGIAGKDIPIAARCLAIADAFDAMTADRPYRDGQSLEYAVMELRKNAGTQFDPDLAQMFIGLVETGEVVVGTITPAKPPIWRVKPAVI